MPAKHSRHIALTGPLTEWVDSQVAQGEYASTSDVIRAAIRLLRAHEEARAEGGSARASPPPKQHGRI